ncbi:histidine--tRNA ligase [Portibacter lacus]|uniref:Histidine--tRNA ligase n=1 Tax=Portibacter lacus TaxID=1099794 RepID=A0AA37SQF4_9BACT|nr:histidine--tRNA ligase [Portibacter lacus]GLR18152.1 histidine--tRNA ligase [Portibacter lacus]
MKPSLPKGIRDFLPNEVLKRKYIFETVEKVFKKNAYVAIETPTMENLETLTGKYGEEGDQLLFKVMNNGDFLKKSDAQAFEERNSSKFAHSISKRGLRYDLTVPFARYVVMHQNDISFPFKRYQIQPVWRADRPQKGRYQEFYQCDVDVVGSDSLMYEAELVKIYDEVFTALNLEVEIKVNNRKILAGIAEVSGLSDQFMTMTIILDKLDKIGEAKVVEQLEGLGLSNEKALYIIELIGSSCLEDFEVAFQDSEMGQLGIQELKDFHQYLDVVTTNNKVVFDPSLARGLSYYTGCIFEVKSLETEMGSIGGGGRYADLTSNFGLKNMPGVGVSFGAERIYDVMEELGKFPETLSVAPDILFVTFGAQEHIRAFKWSGLLREKGIVSDVYPDFGKMKKQMKYADQINVQYVAIIGEEEMNKDVVSLKNMKTGEQEEVNFDALLTKIDR